METNVLIAKLRNEALGHDLSGTPLDELLEAAADRLEILQADVQRLDNLQEMIRVCPHSVITFNDDEDVEDDHGMVPVGFSIRIDGCKPLEAVADNLRSVIDMANALSVGQQEKIPPP